MGNTAAAHAAHVAQMDRDIGLLPPLQQPPPPLLLPPPPPAAAAAAVGATECDSGIQNVSDSGAGVGSEIAVDESGPSKLVAMMAMTVTATPHFDSGDVPRFHLGRMVPFTMHSLVKRAQRLNQYEVFGVMPCARDSSLTQWLHRRRQQDHIITTYQFTVRCAAQQWGLSKRFSEFVEFRKQLKDVHGADPPPVPSRLTWFASAETIAQNRAEMLSIFMQLCLSQAAIVQSAPFHEFLEISRLSFDPRFGRKRKEGYLMKQAASQVVHGMIGLEDAQRFWVVPKDTFLALFHSPLDEQPSDVFLYDSGLAVRFGVHDTISSTIIVIVTHAGRLHLRAPCAKRAEEFVAAVSTITSRNTCPWLHKQPYNSFAPIRTGTMYVGRAPTPSGYLTLASSARWLVDGMPTFEAMADAMEAATMDIMISGWWVCPDLMLRRHTHPEDFSWRLADLVKRKAQQGVHVYIMIYKEVELALPLNSQYAADSLGRGGCNVHIVRHGGLLWSHHDKMVIVDRCIAFVGGLDLAFGRADTPDHIVADQSNVHGQTLWPGMDYYNPRIKDFAHVHQPHIDLVERKIHGRMPWHDVHSQVFGDAALDIARHYIHRWNHHRTEMVDPPRVILPFAPDLGLVQHHMPSSWVGDVTDPTWYCAHALSTAATYHQVDVQAVRSMGQWSGMHTVERSIYSALVDHIRLAKHSIYIENQFFVTSADEPLPGQAVGAVPTVLSIADTVQNKVGEALYHRISHAIRHKQAFKVIVVLPVWPGFEGDVQSSVSIQAVLLLQYASISRSPTSLLRRLSADFPHANLSDYISFYALRSHGMVNGVPVTEQIYVHSKLMIVDDNVVVIGSANINDRSLRGDRDSEIAVVITGGDKVPSLLAGKPVMVSRFAHTFRRALWEEHLGLQHSCNVAEELTRAMSRATPSSEFGAQFAASSLDIDATLQLLAARKDVEGKLGEDVCVTGALVDPASDRLYQKVWKATAAHNSRAYNHVFPNWPRDDIQTLTQLRHAASGPMDAEAVLPHIRGHLVQFPLLFLSEENLSVPLTSKEFLVPQRVFQ